LLSVRSSLWCEINDDGDDGDGVQEEATPTTSLNNNNNNGEQAASRATDSQITGTRQVDQDANIVTLYAFFITSELLKYCDGHVCVCVCLSVCSRISKTTRPNYAGFSVRLGPPLAA